MTHSDFLDPNKKNFKYIIKSMYFFRGKKERKINLIITSNFIKLINYENKFKNNLKNLSICNDGFSENLVGFWYKKQGLKSKEGFSCKNYKKPKPAFGRCSQQKAMTWPHYGSRLTTY